MVVFRFDNNFSVAFHQVLVGREFGVLLLLSRLRGFSHFFWIKSLTVGGGVWKPLRYRFGQGS